MKVRAEKGGGRETKNHQKGPGVRAELTDSTRNNRERGGSGQTKRNPGFWGVTKGATLCTVKTKTCLLAITNLEIRETKGGSERGEVKKK